MKLRGWGGCFGIAWLATGGFAQDRLAQYPGYTHMKERAPIVAKAYQDAIASVRATPVQWLEDGKAVAWKTGTTWQRYDLVRRAVTNLGEQAPPAAAPRAPARRPAVGAIGRGRQRGEVTSPDGTQIGFYRERQLWVRRADGSNERRLLPTDPLATPPRVKYGTASWVYGEELEQRAAFGWSPDGKRLWCYRFDETNVVDYHLTLDVTKVQNRVASEPYPKAGAPNPIVDLFVVNVSSGQTTAVAVRPLGAAEDGVGHYVYDIAWSESGDALRFFRTDRLQRTREFCVANPADGSVRVAHRETALTWVDNRPPRWPARPGTEIWRTTIDGFANFIELNLSTFAQRELTRHPFDVNRVEWFDAQRGDVWYETRGPQNPYCNQYYRLNFNKSVDRRITDPALSHRINISPDGEAFVDFAESAAAPPTVTLRDRDGKALRELVRANAGPFLATGARPNERLTFPSLDGKVMLYGTLQYPSDFDARRRYPLLVLVYAGPDSGGGSEQYAAPSRWTELGFLVASFEGRGMLGRGKAFTEAVYGHLGIIEIDDQAAGVRYLAQRPYVRADRVGIQGASYGGYASAMAILRYPDTFAAALAESSVTDWRNYDTIYTERYMGLPRDNAEGYRLGAAASYAGQLKGRLMLTYGTADDNVHPANSYQLATALQRAGRGFSMMALPDQEHSAVREDFAMEFFVEHLILTR